ncbi:hypothetical protein GHT06_009694 [Daphnia sinensis]|uniref:Uncharacterized protein n=1 Tax=Daphnia sinensis TaxID=1820382 RepID=A0AAD5L3L1_9CRUS|nr:hypothetical protein GHT06_009694 [Daphnia sinensis]
MDEREGPWNNGTAQDGDSCGSIELLLMWRGAPWKTNKIRVVLIMAEVTGFATGTLMKRQTKHHRKRRGAVPHQQFTASTLVCILLKMRLNRYLFKIEEEKTFMVALQKKRGTGNDAFRRQRSP